MRWPLFRGHDRPAPPNGQDQRDPFSEALEEALTSEDIRLGLENTTATSVADLREEMEAERDDILGQAQVSDAEKRYLAARAEVTAPDQERPPNALLRWSVVALAVLVVLATCLMYGWSAALQGPVGSYRDAPVLSGAVLGRALGALGTLLFIGVLAHAGVRAASRFRPPTAPRDTEAEGPIAVAALIAMITAPVLGYATHDVVVHFAGSDPGSGWLVFLGAAAAYVLFFMGPVRSWRARLLRPDDEDRTATTRTTWQAEIVEEATDRLRLKLNELIKRRYALTLQEFGKDGLRQVRDLRYHVRTPAQDRLVTVVNGMTDGSVALSGPRGVGKTDLLEAVRGGRCGVPVGLSVAVTAPVAYDRREFMLHLFAKICERVRDAGSRELRAQAETNLEWIRYLQTVSSEVTAAVPPRLLSLGLRRGVSRARQPLTYPEIVNRLRGFLERVTQHLGCTGTGPRLIIAVDELDRIQPAADARRFLSEIKVIFDVRFCLFLLAVSDDALREAELAAVGRRDVFDSAIDEVVRVEPLDQPVAESLLSPRVVGLSAYFAALFNCLACGIPRDLLRVARAAILFSTAEEGKHLDGVAERLVERELSRINGSVSTSRRPAGPFHDIRALSDAAERLNGADPALANRLYFLDTVLGVFTHENIEARGRTALEAPAGDPISFTTLAFAGSKIGMADRQARTDLQAIRTTWKLPDIPPLA